MISDGVEPQAKVPGRKWIALDLDGTLAHYDRSDKRTGRLFIGEPVPAMVERVKAWMAMGHVPVIFTSRVADPTKADHFEVVKMIQTWCETHLGARLAITAVKHGYFSCFIDDNAHHVIRNTGAIIPSTGLP